MIPVLVSQVGRDVSDCLQQAMVKKGLDMRVAVLVNTFLTYLFSYLLF